MVDWQLKLDPGFLTFLAWALFPHVSSLISITWGSSSSPASQALLLIPLMNKDKHGQDSEHLILDHPAPALTSPSSCPSSAPIWPVSIRPGSRHVRVQCGELLQGFQSLCLARPFHSPHSLLTLPSRIITKVRKSTCFGSHHCCTGNLNKCKNKIVRKFLHHNIHPN